LENGSRIVASSTSSSAVRGGSYNMIFLDEFAFVPHNVAEDFFSSVYPTISSGQKTKVVIVSTPNGMNLFYKLWSDAENGRNSYNPIEVHWSEIPGRDEKWKKETIANTSQEQFNREFECEFLGSINTLVHPTKIKSMVFDDPIQRNAGLELYKKPEKGRTYALVADVARGTEQDYSAFLVFDVS
ncbi:MAG: terminase family protein, partial [Thermoproteota archaeon]|nr:terminase family protein [Thermoproteota archaeon]